MQIKFMTPTQNPDFKTKAYFSVETKNFYIHGCRLVMGSQGRLVVMMPFRESVKKGVKIFESVIEIKNVDYLEAVGEMAVKVYESLA